MTRFIFTYLVGLAMAMPSMAQVKVSLSTDQTTIRQNELLPIKIEVSADRQLSLPDADLQVPVGFKRVSGQQSSGTSISIVNGQYQVSQSSNQVWMAEKTGTFTIGPATVNINGSIIKSNTIKITVAEAGADVSEDDNGKPRVIFLEPEISTTRPVVGQPVYVKYNLYFATRIRNLSVVQEPTVTGALVEMMDTRGFNPKPETVIQNGIEYNRIKIREIVVYPQRSGEVIVEPFVLAMQAAQSRQRTRNSVFDDFLFDPFQEYRMINVSSANLRLDVKDITPPAGFSGFVGTLEADVKISRKEVPVNESVSVTLSVTGVGNFKNFIAPDLQFGETVETYPPKENRNLFKSAQGEKGTIEVEYILIPRYAGNIEIPPIEIRYYDLKAGQFKTKMLPGQSVTVAGGSEAGAPVAYQPIDFRTIGQDISFIKTATTLISSTKSQVSMIHYVLIACVVLWLALLGLLIVQMKNKADMADRRGFAHKYAEKFARKAFEKARHLAETEDIKVVLGEIQRVFSHFIAHKTRLDETAWTVEEVLGILQNRQMEPEKRDRISAFLNRLNELRFAPAGWVEISKNELLEQAEHILTDLSEALG